MSSVGASYLSYLEAYNKKANFIKDKYGERMQEPKLTREEFLFAYKTERAKMKVLVSEGKRKQIGNITQNIVSKQAYKTSQGQALALKGAYKELGEDVKLVDIRFGNAITDELNEELKDIYYEQRRAGMSGKQAKEYISQIYFGS